MDLGSALAAAGLLVIAVIAIIFVVKKGATAPTCPPPDVSFFVLNDGTKVATNVACSNGSRIKVRNSAYGAPWGGCAWTDTTAAADALMGGKQQYSIPANTALTTLLGISDSCPGVPKTLAGAFTCER
jgi:hypothetical protein